FTDLYAKVIDREDGYSDQVYAGKLLIMRASMASEINVLGHQLNGISERDRRSRDFTLNSLTHAIREIIACFPVYRTYIENGSVTERDRALIEREFARAKRKTPAPEASIFNFVRDVLLLRYPDSASEADHEAQRAFVKKFQQ